MQGWESGQSVFLVIKVLQCFQTHWKQDTGCSSASPVRHCLRSGYKRYQVEHPDRTQLFQLMFSNDFLLKQIEKDFKNEFFKERTKQMTLQMQFKCGGLRD